MGKQHTRPCVISLGAGVCILFSCAADSIASRVPSVKRSATAAPCLERGVLLVLIVDDDPAIAEFMFALLTDEGYAVAVVADGQDALAYLRQARQLPCLILLDLHMPIMNAWDFRAAQLLDPALAHIPVVLFSTVVNLEQLATELGAVGALPKTIDIDSILRVVLQYCAPDRA
jgi:CheY-like chemotaxis protein